MVEYHNRRNRLIASFSDTFDAILITDVLNVRYLTGFTGSNGALLLGPGGLELIATDGRYLIQVAAQAPDLECLDARDVAPALVARAAAHGVRRLAIEAAEVTLERHDAMAGAAAGMALIPTTSMVEKLRVVKDDDELAALTRACQITDAAFADLLTQLRSGVSEQDMAWRLRASIREHGGDGLAFDSIVAFGPHSAIPHHVPTDRALAPGDFIKLDFGARSAGYHADMTRTVVLGPAAQWQRDLHGLVQGIQAECRDAAVMGALPRDLDAQAREAISAAGYQTAHGLGHGVGLAVHELPFLSARSTADRLTARVPVTIEPGVYLPERGGVRIEDTIIVGTDGTRSLTTSSRDLIEIA
jgi:Xaa-Pro aminopeptidase